MANTAIAPFGFPDNSDPIDRPSVMDDRIAVLRRAVAAMIAGLFISIIINAIAIPVLFNKADVIPFAADGGIYGCRVTTVPASQVTN